MLSAEQRHSALIDALVAAGDLRDPALIAAFRAVPRHLFVPRRGAATAHGTALDADARPDHWLASVYTDDAIVTQIDDGDPDRPRGMPTSSCSAPPVVARMLEAAGLRDGHRVLEVGTGTGWNAALLAARLGDDRVVSVEIDPEVWARARKALHAAGRAPLAVLSDGAEGHPPGAPYDRTIATCAVARVPPAWIRQTVPGGLVVLPWTTWEGAGRLARRRTAGAGPGSGPFLSGIGFMPRRAQRPAPGAPTAPEGAVPDETRLLPEPDPVSPLTRFASAFPITFMVPGWRMGLRHSPGIGGRSLWLASTDGRSWARVVPTGAGWRAEQAGPRSLWDEVGAARARWTALGRPPLERFGLTVGADGRHRVWLDAPDGPGWPQEPDAPERPRM